MERAKQIAMRELKHMGFAVDDISECDAKRADFVATDGISTYVVEVKQKLDDLVRRSNEVRRMADGEIVSNSEPHSHSNRFDGIFKHGRDQLYNTPRHPEAFSIIWFYAEGMDADLKARRACNTFYGLVPLIPLSGNSDGNSEIVQCFYFDFKPHLECRPYMAWWSFMMEGYSFV